RNPSEPRWLDTAAHVNAIGEHHINACLIENPFRITARFFLSYPLLVFLPFPHVQRIRVVVWVIPQHAPREQSAWIVWAQLHWVGGWLHVVDRQCIEFAVLFACRYEPHRMRVIVNGANAGYFGENFGSDIGAVSGRAGAAGNENKHCQPRCSRLHPTATACGRVPECVLSPARFPGKCIPSVLR